jgi:hypothetical protein
MNICKERERERERVSVTNQRQKNIWAFVNVWKLAAVQQGHRPQLRLAEVKEFVAKVACVPFGAV